MFGASTERPARRRPAAGTGGAEPAATVGRNGGLASLAMGRSKLLAPFPKKSAPSAATIHILWRGW